MINKMKSDIIKFFNDYANEEPDEFINKFYSDFHDVLHTEPIENIINEVTTSAPYGTLKHSLIKYLKNAQRGTCNELRMPETPAPQCATLEPITSARDMESIRIIDEVIEKLNSVKRRYNLGNPKLEF